MKQARPGVIVIGAGIAGLAAAVDLSRHDMAVTVVERAASPGGKLREAVLGDARIDSGPTVLTLRRVLDELFADAGASLDVALRLTPAEVLGRHAWQDGTTLDLHADAARSAEAIAAFAGAAAADGFRAFRARARQVFATLDGSFMHAARPTIWSLLRNGGLRGLPDLWRISP
jgi:1-hydroxycarotenoid 3,4-desaturase